MQPTQAFNPGQYNPAAFQAPPNNHQSPGQAGGAFGAPNATQAFQAPQSFGPHPAPQGGGDPNADLAQLMALLGGAGGGMPGMGAPSAGVPGTGGQGGMDLASLLGGMGGMPPGATGAMGGGPVNGLVQNADGSVTEASGSKGLVGSLLGGGGMTRKVIGAAVIAAGLMLFSKNKGGLGSTLKKLASYIPVIGKRFKTQAETVVADVAQPVRNAVSEALGKITAEGANKAEVVEALSKLATEASEEAITAAHLPEALKAVLDEAGQTSLVEVLNSAKAHTTNSASLGEAVKTLGEQIAAITDEAAQIPLKTELATKEAALSESSGHVEQIKAFFTELADALQTTAEGAPTAT